MIMNVELRHLRYFLAVAEELHFGRAAQRLFIAQPAVSQQIRKLEGELGVELFHRTKRRVELTTAGEALQAGARRALAEVQAAIEAARRAARGEVGHLTIGFIEAASGGLMPALVRRFRRRRPEVGLTLRELSVDAQLAGLQNGSIDIAIVRPPVESPELELEEIVEEALLVAVPETHPFAGKRSVHPRALAGEPLILLSREVVPGLYDQVLSLQLEHGSAAMIAQEATSIQAVLGLVAAGLGISPLPDSVRSLEREGVRFVPLKPSPLSTMLVAWRRDDRSPLTAAFLAVARS
jgi:DNA-binding transcriptional LysR family regulator